jgi:hypothetical protein
MKVRILAVFLLLVALPVSASAEGEFKIERVKQAPPKEVPAAILADLNPEACRITKDGKPFAEFWWRKATPVDTKPSGPNGTILFPVFKMGQLMGVLKYVEEGQDYRDQAIPPGVYTMRYGLQPINGAHLGVSPYRDYVLLLQASKDTSLDNLAKKGLEERSSEAAGSSHPAVLMLLNPPDSVKKTPEMTYDDSKQTWGAVVALPVGVKGTPTPVSLNVQLVVSGAAAP